MTQRNRVAWTTILVGLWLGLAGGLIELVVLALKRHAYPLTRVSNDFVWMSPLALVGVTLIPSVIGALLTLTLPARSAFAVSVVGASALAALNLMLLVPGLSHYAAALIAAGVGAQVARVTIARPSVFETMARRSTLPILGCAVVAGTVATLSLPRPISQPHAAMAATRSNESRAPSVLLITLDTVRAQSLSLYGYSRKTSPNLDRFAERAVVFERAFATAPWTLPSHASLMTGRWPHELSTDYESPLDGKHMTLAEFLAARGYATAGFVANLGYCSYGSGLGRGFAHYEDYPRSIGQLASNSTLVRHVAGNFRLRRFIENDQHLNRVSADDINRRALSWLSTVGTTTPFFAFINYFDAHEPYLPPRPFNTRFGNARARGQYSPLHRWLWDASIAHRPMTDDEIREERDAYDGALAYLDDRLGALLAGMSRQNLLSNTIVIITSDHGEELGEHGLFDHGYSLYRQGLQVPLVIIVPGLRSSAPRVTAAVSLRDVAATIASLTAPDVREAFPGESLAPFWTESGAGEKPRSPAMSEVRRVTGQPAWFPASKGDMAGVVYGDFHYIKNGEGNEELYRDDDVEERTNLAGKPEYVDALIEGRAILRPLTD